MNKEDKPLTKEQEEEIKRLKRNKWTLVFVAIILFIILRYYVFN
jgi:hypothetical protein|tara:strand:+ start:102 stop:233 length:132 start_codon:yes stop_codon:yes gene_type:complete